MIAEMRLKSFREETEEMTELLKLQKSVRENYERRFGLGAPKDIFGKDLALSADEQDENELDSLFKMLRTELIST